MSKLTFELYSTGGGKRKKKKKKTCSVIHGESFEIYKLLPAHAKLQSVFFWSDDLP
jgi:hypothetical protein